MVAGRIVGFVAGEVAARLSTKARPHYVTMEQVRKEPFRDHLVLATDTTSSVTVRPRDGGPLTKVLLLLEPEDQTSRLEPSRR